MTKELKDWLYEKRGSLKQHFDSYVERDQSWISGQIYMIEQILDLFGDDCKD